MTDIKKAVLAAADTGEYDVETSLDELAELALTAGLEVAGRAWQKRDRLDASFCIGVGKLDEIKEFCQNNGVAVIVFDHELSATQLRNIEQHTETAVIDRTMLILDIFAQRADSSEGRLQVELAQLRYRLPRIMGMGQVLSRLGGGIGTRGPGETKLETDRRHIRRRIEALTQRLARMEHRRLTVREKRRDDGFVTVAIVGYTNVGKSTLLNALTGSDVAAADMLFATLDPTARALDLPDGRRVILTDTVGLVRRLPHHLVEAFKSTLEQALYADLILNVCDISAPDAFEQLDVTRGLLEELGLKGTPVLTVCNKCDLVAQWDSFPGEDCCFISAKSGSGLPELLALIARRLPQTQRRLRLLIPYGTEGLISKIREEGKIFSHEYAEDGNLVDALVDVKLVNAVAPYVLHG